ncbi:MAG: hypothetical protein RIF36_17615 [Imperialibacter sp.]|uniref:hypothetical protein n=1 Tax=Imperialibacter sp. TaxID=2038411 RepID=UPI0032F0056F
MKSKIFKVIGALGGIGSIYQTLNEINMEYLKDIFAENWQTILFMGMVVFSSAALLIDWYRTRKAREAQLRIENDVNLKSIINNNAMIIAALLYKEKSRGSLVGDDEVIVLPHNLKVKFKDLKVSYDEDFMSDIGKIKNEKPKKQ